MSIAGSKSGFTLLLLPLFVLLASACGTSYRAPHKVQAEVVDTLTANTCSKVITGADRMDTLLPILKGRRVALFVNQTSIAGKRHLVDTLLSQGIDIRKIFVPEHGFRGNIDAGMQVDNDRDERTGLDIISLYGRSRKPSRAQLKDVEILLFDMQDVGCRFYTYISSMHYAMEAAAETGVHFIVTDRPNPNDTVDGPMLEANCRSFAGVDPLPVLHGLTIGELALMINNEGWLADGISCRLSVIPMLHWQHGDAYSLPIAPSPNLPNDQSVGLYPSLCLFEATIMSVGRGTNYPFQVLGYPDKNFGSFSFIPVPILGADSDPVCRGRECYGIDLRHVLPGKGFRIDLVSDFYHRADSLGLKLINRARTFDILAGNKHLRKAIESGYSEAEIRAGWQPGLEAFKRLRRRYLLYPDNRIGMHPTLSK